jgi:hypothetical protein
MASLMSGKRYRNGSSRRRREVRETVAAWDVVREGDAYDLMRTLRPNSVDLLLTSPPYWGHRTYEQQHNWRIVEELGRDPLPPPLTSCTAGVAAFSVSSHFPSGTSIIS